MLTQQHYCVQIHIKPYKSKFGDNRRRNNQVTGKQNFTQMMNLPNLPLKSFTNSAKRYQTVGYSFIKRVTKI